MKNELSLFAVTLLVAQSFAVVACQQQPSTAATADMARGSAMWQRGLELEPAQQEALHRSFAAEYKVDYKVSREIVAAVEMHLPEAAKSQKLRHTMGWLQASEFIRSVAAAKGLSLDDKGVETVGMLATRGAAFELGLRAPECGAVFK